MQNWAFPDLQHQTPALSRRPLTDPQWKEMTLTQIRSPASFCAQLSFSLYFGAFVRSPYPIFLTIHWLISSTMPQPPFPMCVCKNCQGYLHVIICGSEAADENGRQRSGYSACIVWKEPLVSHADLLELLIAPTGALFFLFLLSGESWLQPPFSAHFLPTLQLAEWHVL